MSAGTTLDAETLTVERLLKSVDMKAIGEHVALAVADFVSKPEVLAALVEFFSGKKKPRIMLDRAGRRTRASSRTCSIEGCSRPAIAKGLCSRHYQRMRYQMKKKRAPRVKTQIRGSGTCSVQGCGRTIHARGMCGKHFMEWVRTKRK